MIYIKILSQFLAGWAEEQYEISLWILKIPGWLPEFDTGMLITRYLSSVGVVGMQTIGIIMESSPTLLKSQEHKYSKEYFRVILSLFKQITKYYHETG